MAEIAQHTGPETGAQPAAPQIEWRPPGELRPNPNNARKHSKKQIKQLAAIIRATGFIGAIITDENDVILGGTAG
jgi:ParB-like chromosome segregation protein Spo0J